MELTVFTDGASRGNPGPASYGFVVIKDGEVIQKQGKYIGFNTNNVAEYTAVLKALAWIKENLPQTKKIKFFMDSNLVSKQLSGKFKIKSPHLLIIINKIWEFEKSFEVISFDHVYREENKLADSMANLALDSR